MHSSWEGNPESTGKPRSGMSAKLRARYHISGGGVSGEEFVPVLTLKSSKN